jgi:hypothetical protein
VLVEDRRHGTGAALGDELDLTRAKPGCGEGACGSCTVLVGGDPVRTQPVSASEAGRRASSVLLTISLAVSRTRCLAGHLLGTYVPAGWWHDWLLSASGESERSRM